MIVVTGAAGLIGSHFVQHLNQYGYTDLILVDDFTEVLKYPLWQNAHYSEMVPVEDFFDWAAVHGSQVDFIVHLGVQVDDAVEDYSIFKKWNVEYAQRVWSWATQQRIPLIYASSAETYGDGPMPCLDDEKTLYKFNPLTLWGRSKHEFDKWVQKQFSQPPFWYGFKFFNVFGLTENDRVNKQSALYRLVRQIMLEHKATLPCLSGKEPVYDFIYVSDVATVMMWFMNHLPPSGLYNLGTGYARPLSVAAQSAFSILKIHPQWEFAENAVHPLPPLAGLYANLAKLRKIQYKKNFLPLETSVRRFVKTCLNVEK